MWIFFIAALLFIALVASLMVVKQSHARAAILEQRLKELQAEEDRVFDFLHGIGAAFSEGFRSFELHRLIVESSTRILDARFGALYLANKSDSSLTPTFMTAGCPAFFPIPDHILQQAGESAEALESFLQLQPVTKDTPGPIADCWRTGEARLLTAGADGLLPAHSAIVGPLVDKAMKATYDATKFTYLASADSGTRVCISLPNARIKTFSQAQTERVIVGAAGNGASSRDYGYLHKNTSGAKFEVVSGYKGMADILLAMERSEIDVVCGLDWSSAKAQRPGLVRDKTLNVLVQMGIDKNAELDAWGVPEIMSFTQGADNRAIVELIVAQQTFGHSFLTENLVHTQNALRQLTTKVDRATLHVADILVPLQHTRVVYRSPCHAVRNSKIIMLILA